MTDEVETVVEQQYTYSGFFAIKIILLFVLSGSLLTLVIYVPIRYSTTTNEEGISENRLNFWLIEMISIMIVIVIGIVGVYYESTMVTLGLTICSMIVLMKTMEEKRLYAILLMPLILVIITFSVFFSATLRSKSLSKLIQQAKRNELEGYNRLQRSTPKV